MSIRAIGSQPAEQGPRRVALVAGGGGGIGQAVCDQLARDGMALAVADVDPQRAAACATAASAHGVDAIWVELNATEQSSVQRAAAEVAQRLGPVDVLVSCIGVNAAVPFLRSDEPAWRQMVEVNLVGAMRLARWLVPSMVERGWGRVVNVAADSGRIGMAEEALMSATAGGLIAFTKALAREVVRHGVTANTVCPGPTATPMLDQMISQSEDATQMIAALTRSVPIGRLGQPQEVAPAVSFFVSEAAGYVTGQTLSVSGGLSMA